MAILLSVNGSSYSFPEPNDTTWGQSVTDWATAITNGTLQKAGGNFTLLSEVDFGSSFGLRSSYYKTKSSNISSTGQFRLAQTDSISWRDNSNTVDLSLTVNPSNQLTFNGLELVRSGLINNASIASDAAISLSKLAQVSSSKILVSDMDGVITSSSVDSAKVEYLDATSSIQAQLDSKLNIAGGTLTGALILNSDPVTSLGAVTKQYVDNLAAGLKGKLSVRVATTENGVLASAFQNGSTVDGVILVTGDRILIKNQSVPSENGIYTVNLTGAPTRASDSNTWNNLVSAYVFVEKGSSQSDSGWLCSVDAGGTLGTSDVTFVQYSQAGVITTDNQGISKTGTILSITLDGSTLTKSGSGLRLSSTLETEINSKLTNPMTTDGDLVSRSSGTPSRIAVGSNGQVLTVVSGSPVWANAPGTTIVAVTSDLTLTSSDTNKLYLVDTTSALSITLPSPSLGLKFTFKDKTGTSTTNVITIVRTGTEKIEGVAASKILQANWGCWTLVSDGTDWFMV